VNIAKEAGFMSAEDATRPRVGVATIIWRNDDRKELLLGKGHSDAANDEIYAVTGGHWDSGEKLHEAALREAQEEAGIEVTDLELISVYDFFNEEKQRSYVTIGFAGIWSGGEPTVLEANKKVDWGWYTPENALALPLFEPDRKLIQRAAAKGSLYEFAGD
jgi:8-oxo-dGTP diphosphatase